MKSVKSHISSILDDTPAAEFWPSTLIVSSRNAHSMQNDDNICTIEKSKSVKNAIMITLLNTIPP